MRRVNPAVVLAVLFGATICSAQVQTGTPPFATFGGGPDLVNLANLNSHINIPIINKAGRGTPFTYSLGYDSSVWYPVGSSGHQNWQPVVNWGWQGLTPNLLGYVSYVLAQQSFCSYDYQYYTTYYNWSYTDPLGVSHQLNAPPVSTDQYCGNMRVTGTATDGSGYAISIYVPYYSNPQVFYITVTSKSGSQIYNPPVNTTTPGSGSVTDRNGNEITLSNGVFTDTLGTTALTVSGAGTSTSPITLVYTAPSAGASCKVNYTNYTVATNFGASGISEYKSASALPLVSSVVLPDGSQYTFVYEATPSTPSAGACTPYAGTTCVTARVKTITLPTGGTINYSYSGGNNGILPDGSTATLTRTTPDSGANYWTYAHSESGTAWATTVTDPQNNQTAYSFQGIYQTERKVYQGTTTLLEDDVTCYNGNTTSCNTTAITLPITERIVTKTLGTQVCKHVYFYNTSGLLTEQDDYDYGTGSPGSTPIRKTLTSYASLGNNILDRPASITIQNGTGTTLAKTTYTYDQGTPTALSGTPQHVSISGSRGNPTTISSLVAGSTTLSKSFTYFDTGNIQTATDVNATQTTYNYANATSTCGNTFPTSVSEPVSLSRSMTWNCTGGVETSVTDENTNTASTTYTDSHFWRPASSKDQEQNATNFVYASLTSVESSLNFNGSSSTVDVLATLDGLGRAHVNQRKQSPSASNYDSVETDYDSLGRPSKVTVPYGGTAGQTGGSAPATTATYDALSRPLVTTDGGNGTVTLSYSANDILQTVGPAPTGENPKQRQSEYNSIGQLTSVCEITSTLPGKGTCAQNTSATGYWTKYAYDAAGRLLTVTQNAQSAQAQARSFTYDDLGRMTSEANPETGTIHYVYDSDATCGTSNGDLVKKTDAAGNVICYAYDALHRATSITYPSGPNSSNTPSKHFIYDAATVNSVAMANAKTRLAEAYTCVSPCSTKITDEGFSYTVRGEVQDVYESTPHSGGYFHVDETYWANGALNQISGVSGLPTLTYAPDGEGRANSVSASSGQNPVSSTAYNVSSEATQVTLGSSDTDAFQFDPTTFRITQYKFTVNSQSVVGNLTWNANGSLGKLAITDAFNSANTQTCTYSHDDLSRIASGNCGSIWSQTFSYDAFGNITKTGSEQFQPGYNLNNQMATGATYDAMGDVLSDSLHSYAWNSDTRPTTIDTVTVTYDALGRMVEQSKSGLNTEIVYDGLGNKLALMNGTATLVKGFAPLPAGATAVYNATGLQYYRHPDWLGSSRFASTSTRTMYNDLAYAPFGEQYAQAGSTGVTDTSFAGNNKDTAANLYDAQFREYGIQGRWPSPDPAGFAAANPANPQSWNRYAYVLNNPLSLTDPTGKGPGLASDCPAEYQSCGSADGGEAEMVGGGGGGGGGGVTFGCDEFDALDPNSYCSTTILPVLNGTYSPFQYQYTGPASDWQTETFDTWDQYADWRTTVAAGAPDPCVYMNDSATGVQYVDYNSSPGECANSPGGGGNWVPPGFNYHVDSVSGTVVWQPQAAQSQGNSWSHPFAPPTCHQLGVWAAGDAAIAVIASGGGKSWNPVVGVFAIAGGLETLAYAVVCQ